MLGYAAMNRTLRDRDPPVRCNRGMRKQTWESRGLPYASELTLTNLRDLLELLRWNVDHDVFFYRCSSDLVPWHSQYELSDLPDYAEIARVAERFHATDADAFVAVGGGSSVDLARVASVVAASPHAPEELGSQLASTGTVQVPDDVSPVVAVPTTLAGAGLSMLAGVTASPDSGLVDHSTGGGIGDPQLMSALAVYDPQIIAETPDKLLVGSAFNGFDKGVEALYASTRTPITDATASRGLSLLVEALPRLASDTSPDSLEPVVRGVILVQYGTSRASGTSFSVLHAIGHALRVHTGVQLGVAYAAVAPDVLAWVFDDVDGRRRLLADALGVADAADADDDVADAVVAAVRDLRASLGLPDRLRDVDGIDADSLDAVADTAADSFLGANDAPDTDRPPRASRETAHGWSGTPHTPPGLTVSQSAVRAVLDSAW